MFVAFFTLLISATSNAQQDPLFIQYNSNAFLVNPAVAGSKGNHSLNIFHRWQWVLFPGAPHTFGLSYQTLFKDLHGVGALLFGDITGPTSRFGAKLSYAFHIPLANRKMRLSLGLAARLAHNTIRTDMVQLVNPNDIAIANGDRGVMSADAEFGVYFYTKKLCIGFAAPNLIQTRIDFGETAGGRDPIGQGYRHYFLSAAYKIELPAQKISLTPSLMLKYVQGNLPQLDGGLTVHFLDDQISVGAFYRSPAFLAFQFKFLFDQKIPVIIGFDFALNDFQQYSVGSTEIMLGYDFPAVDLFIPNEKEPEGKL